MNTGVQLNGYVLKLPLIGSATGFAHKATGFCAVNIHVPSQTLGTAVVVTNAQAINSRIHGIDAVGDFAGGAIRKIYVARIAIAGYRGSNRPIE